MFAWDGLDTTGERMGIWRRHLSLYDGHGAFSAYELVKRRARGVDGLVYITLLYFSFLLNGTFFSHGQPLQPQRMPGWCFREEEMLRVALGSELGVD